MKKQNSLRNLLGITQQEMAVLLNVSRGQWSMYECGRRDLPKHAVLLLAEIVTHLQSPEDKTSQSQQDSNDNRRQLLEQLLRDNQYERLLLEKNRARVEKQLQADTARKQLSDFIAQRTITNKERSTWPLVAPKVSDKNFEKECDTQLLRLELKAELLSLEKLLLESKLQKINNAPNVNTSFRSIDEKE